MPGSATRQGVDPPRVRYRVGSSELPYGYQLLDFGHDLTASRSPRVVGYFTDLTFLRLVLLELQASGRLEATPPQASSVLP